MTLTGKLLPSFQSIFFCLSRNIIHMSNDGVLMVKLGRGGASFSRRKDCLREYFGRTSRRCLQTEASPGLECSSLILIRLPTSQFSQFYFHLHRSGHASLELLKPQEHDITKPSLLSCLSPLISDVTFKRIITFLHF